MSRSEACLKFAGFIFVVFKDISKQNENSWNSFLLESLFLFKFGSRTYRSCAPHAGVGHTANGQLRWLAADRSRVALSYGINVK